MVYVEVVKMLNIKLKAIESAAENVYLPRAVIVSKQTDESLYGER